MDDLCFQFDAELSQQTRITIARLVGAVWSEATHVLLTHTGGSLVLVVVGVVNPKARDYITAFCVERGGRIMTRAERIAAFPTAAELAMRN